MIEEVRCATLEANEKSVWTRTGECQFPLMLLSGEVRFEGLSIDTGISSREVTW